MLFIFRILLINTGRGKSALAPRFVSKFTTCRVGSVWAHNWLCRPISPTVRNLDRRGIAAIRLTNDARLLLNLKLLYLLQWH